MAKQKKPTEPKVTLEREYIVPLRKEWLKVPEYKRASKAIKALKQFIARHMKLYDSDLRNVKIDQLLNNEIRFRGMKKPPARIKVRAKKLDNNTIRVELVDLPTHVKFAQIKEQKKIQEIKKKVEEKQESKPKETEEEKSEEKESKESKKETKKTESKDSVNMQSSDSKSEIPSTKQEHKTQKTTSKDKSVKVNRKTLSR
jgi:large subunit ribosomal protein L31e